MKKKINIFLVLCIIFVQASEAVEIKSIPVQISNAGFELNETMGALEMDIHTQSQDAKELKAMWAELEYLKEKFNQLKQRSDENEEWRSKLNEIYIGLLAIELKARIIHSEIDIIKTKKFISAAEVKIEAAKQVSSSMDANLQNAQTSLLESQRLLSESANYTLTLPSVSTEISLKKLSQMVDKKLFLIQSSLKEAEKSLNYSEAILIKSQSMHNISLMKLKELDENISRTNASITAVFNKGVSVVKARSYISESMELEKEAHDLFMQNKYNEAENKIVISEDLRKQAVVLIEADDEEYRDIQTRANMIYGIVIIFAIVIVFWYLKRPPQL